MNGDRVRLLAQELQLLRSRQMEVRFHGLSMLPFLREGDRVVVEPVAWEDIRAGDLITYRDADKFPTRRVVGKGSGRLVLWCDNWPDLRYRVPRDQVLGRAAARERDGAWLGREDHEWHVATGRALAAFRAQRPRHALRQLRNVAARLLGLPRSAARGAR